jgi:DeoR/GlpR family transcriptional regulator of sugar metabolism
MRSASLGIEHWKRITTVAPARRLAFEIRAAIPPQIVQQLVLLVHGNVCYYLFMHDHSLPTSRREVIADRLDAGLSVVASELAEEFQISEDAIRRDLRTLAAEGRCKRVYGGALPVSPASGALAERVSIQPREKILLARTGARLIQTRGLIFLDGGSTNLALVAELPEDKLLNIATNSVPVANAVLNRKGLKLLMVGGAVEADLAACVDADAVLAVQRMNIDHCFLGACAVSSELGLGGFNPADALFKRVLLSRSQRVTALVTLDKLDTRAPHVIGPLECIHDLVVPHDTPSHVLATLAKAGITVLTADKPPQTAVTGV